MGDASHATRDVGSPQHVRALDFRKVCTIEPSRASGGLEWVGLEAARYIKLAEFETASPPFTHHRLVLFLWPPEELELRYEGVKRHVPPPAGSISVLPAGSRALLRWSGRIDSLHIYLEPGLVERVAAEAFDLDPGRLTVPPLDGLNLPHLRAAMGAVDAELTAGGAGGPLAAESLANVLAVHLIRHVLAPRRTPRRPDGTLPRSGSVPSSSTSRGTSTPARPWSRWPPSLASAPITSRISSSGPPGCRPTSTSSCTASSEPSSSCKQERTFPWQRSRHAPGSRIRASFCRHFKRLVGVTPGRFRMHARIA